jgi:hypothetical protein
MIYVSFVSFTPAAALEKQEKTKENKKKIIFSCLLDKRFSFVFLIFFLFFKSPRSGKQLPKVEFLIL